MGNNSTANSEEINGLLGRIETALEGPAEMEALHYRISGPRQFPGSFAIIFRSAESPRGSRVW